MPVVEDGGEIVGEHNKFFSLWKNMVLDVVCTRTFTEISEMEYGTTFLIILFLWV